MQTYIKDIKKEKVEKKKRVQKQSIKHYDK